MYYLVVHLIYSTNSSGFNPMNNQSKKNNSQIHISIDEIIDGAVKNAESRRDLSNKEMNEINGGLAVLGGWPVLKPTIAGGIVGDLTS
jgi:hypothetical protein